MTVVRSLSWCTEPLGIWARGLELQHLGIAMLHNNRDNVKFTGTSRSIAVSQNSRLVGTYRCYSQVQSGVHIASTQSSVKNQLVLWSIQLGVSIFVNLDQRVFNCSLMPGIPPFNWYDCILRIIRAMGNLGALMQFTGIRMKPSFFTVYRRPRARYNTFSQTHRWAHAEEIPKF